MTTSNITTLKALSTDNKSATAAIKLAIARIESNDMTERAQRLIVTFCKVASNSSVEFDSSIVERNVYAVEKAKKVIHALTIKSASVIDKYTNAIVFNISKRKVHKNLTNREQNASLCAALECESMTATMKKLHKAESTAATQSSSTRVMLDALDIAENDNDAKECHINDSENARAFVALYAKK